MTRIVVTRTGGFAGIPRRTEVTDPDAVERVLEAARAAQQPAAPRPDGFVYELTVEQECAAAETYTVPESALPAEVRRLRS